MRVHSVKIDQAVEKTIIVKWAKGKNTIDTKPVICDAATSEVLIDKKNGTFAIASRFQPLSDGTYEADISSLTVVCNGETVGMVTFDLASYYGKNDTLQEAHIASTKTEGKLVLVGDATKFPGASI